MTVELSAVGADLIRRAASDAYPRECCGLLTGRIDGERTEITGVHPSENITDGDPLRGFEVDPKLRFDLMRQSEAADDGTVIVGHYHSHPDHPAAPSATDLAMTYETDFIWLICAVTKTGAGTIGCFRPKPDRSAFDALDLRIGVA